MTRYYKHKESVEFEGEYISCYDWLGECEAHRGRIIITEHKLIFYFNKINTASSLVEMLQPDPNFNFLTIHYQQPKGAYRNIKKIFSEKSEGEESGINKKINAIVYRPRTTNQKETETTYIYRNMFLDFIWDLFYRNSFNETKRSDRLKEVILNDTLLAGIKSKLFYHEITCNKDPYEKEWKGVKTTQFNLLGEIQRNKETDIIIDYWNYLLDDSSENVINPKYNQWFESREKELNAVVQSANKLQIKNKKELETLTYKLFIKRQSPGIFILLFHGSGLYHKLRSSFPDILLPRLILAIVFGWVLICTDGSSFKFYDTDTKISNHILSRHSLLISIVGIALLTFLYKENRRNAPSEKSCDLWIRAILIALIGICYSLSISLGINYFGLIKMEGFCNYLGISLCAFYIGFFLQLLLQDKSTTESL